MSSFFDYKLLVLALDLRDQELNRGPRFSDQFEGRGVGDVLQGPAVDGHDAVTPLEPVRALDVHFPGLEVLDVDAARGAGDLETKPALNVLDEDDGHDLSLGLALLRLHVVEPLDQRVAQALVHLVGQGFTSLHAGKNEH